MTRRTRILAGTLALVATTFSFAETVLGSVCTPMVMADVGDARALDGQPGHPDAREAGPGAMDCVLMLGRDADRGGEADPHCPLNPAVGQGCSAVASIPASSGDADSTPDHGTPRVVVVDVRPDLLLSHALFRPPRA